MRALAPFLGLLLMFPGYCMADGESGLDLGMHGAAYYVLRALASLFVVICLIVITYVILRKCSEQGVFRAVGTADGPVEVIQVRAVEAGRRIYLIGVAEKAYIIAWSGETATLIGTLERSSLGE